MHRHPVPHMRGRAARASGGYSRAAGHLPRMAILPHRAGARFGRRGRIAAAGTGGAMVCGPHQGAGAGKAAALAQRRRTELPPASMPLISAATASCKADFSLPSGVLECASAASFRMPTISASGRIFRSFSASSNDSQIASAAVPETSFGCIILNFLSVVITMTDKGCIGCAARAPWPEIMHNGLIDISIGAFFVWHQPCRNRA